MANCWKTMGMGAWRCAFGTQTEVQTLQ